MNATIAKYAVAALVTIGVLVGIWYHGYSSGKSSTQQDLLDSQAESQEKINALSHQNAQLQLRIDALQREAPTEIVRYVQSRGSDPECFDANGLQLLQRYRQYPAELAE